MTYRTFADLGGEAGYGAIACDQDEPFAARWEREAMALMLTTASTGAWNVDHARSVLETLPDYRALSYYEKWLKGLEKLTLECGLLHPDEIVAERMLHPPRLVAQVLRGQDVAKVLSTGASTLRPTTVPARFTVGDHVRTRSEDVEHHTRLPGYARGKAGVIERLHGAHVFPDSNSRGLGEDPQWLYTVTFSGRELWGEERGEPMRVSIDAWEPYLEAFE